MNAEEICKELRIDHSKILNIYAYGSVVYGTNVEYSDKDYIIVYKSAFLPSGSFKDNAISSYDRNIQGVCYSRTGFKDAINNYEIGALECLYLPNEFIIQNKMNFSITKFDEKIFSKKIISKASSSWHLSTLADKDGNTPFVMKNIFHALRILDFAIQIKEHGKIINFSSMNEKMVKIYNNHNIRPYDYYDEFINLQEKLKK